MLSTEQNDLITRIGPATPAGTLMRRYWQPAALVDELKGNRPIKALRLLGEDLVLFRDDKKRYGLMGRNCPHRGTDLSFGRLEHGGLRCAFHGWLFDVADRKSTRLNSSHGYISYAVFCLKKKNKNKAPVSLDKQKKNKQKTYSCNKSH